MVVVDSLAEKAGQSADNLADKVAEKTGSENLADTAFVGSAVVIDIAATGAKNTFFLTMGAALKDLHLCLPAEDSLKNQLLQGGY